MPLTHEMLQLWLNDRAMMEQALGVSVSDMDIDPLFRQETKDALENFWLPNTAKHPEDYLWYTNWEIILKESNLPIGGMGFGGKPDVNGATPTGYIIDKKYQKLGYASEALARLKQWYFTCPEAKQLTATTMPDNTASIAVLLKCGFVEEKQAEGLIHFLYEPAK